ncbi:hypothetical protein PLESTM_001809400 [Pleodorina starrii]|nr:hypothetical protein PLESTM_001809400 [Pleodorina starrii]
MQQQQGGQKGSPSFLASFRALSSFRVRREGGRALLLKTPSGENSYRNRPSSRGFCAGFAFAPSPHRSGPSPLRYLLFTPHLHLPYIADPMDSIQWCSQPASQPVSEPAGP